MYPTTVLGFKVVEKLRERLVSHGSNPTSAPAKMLKPTTW
jgi:hypothetical protein